MVVSAARNANAFYRRCLSSSFSHRFFHSISPRLLPASNGQCFPSLCRPLPLLRRDQGSARIVTTNSSSFNGSEDINDDRTCSSSSYVSVCIKCRGKMIADKLSEALLCFGACSASIDEAGSCDSFDDILITCIFPDHEAIYTSIYQAADSIGLQEIPVIEAIMREQCDWINNMKEMFQPVKVTDGLWVVPACTSPPDPEATNIIVDPGLAFGTGEHPTTKLCLLLLQELIRGGEKFLDYGTGSGILGIAAVKFGAGLAVGIDIDPQAITSACQNSSLNHIQPQKLQLYLVCGEVNPGHILEGRNNEMSKELNINSFPNADEMEKFDIVIANMLLNELVKLAGRIVSYARKGAIVAVSGILAEQIPEIEKCYSLYLNDIKVAEMDGWARVTGTKR